MIDALARLRSPITSYARLGYGNSSGGGFGDISGSGSGSGFGTSYGYSRRLPI